MNYESFARGGGCEKGRHVGTFTLARLASGCHLLVAVALNFRFVKWELDVRVPSVPVPQVVPGGNSSTAALRIGSYLQYQLQNSTE